MQERATLLTVTQVLLQGESFLDLECSSYIVQEQGDHLLADDGSEKFWRFLLLWVSHGCPPPFLSYVRCTMHSPPGLRCPCPALTCRPTLESFKVCSICA